MLFTFATVVVAAILYYFVRCTAAVATQESAESMDELVQLCPGHRQQAERLLSSRAARRPVLAIEEAVRRAIRSLRRDVR